MSVRYLTDENGKRVGVVLPTEEYKRMLEIKEDLENIRIIDLPHG